MIEGNYIKVWCEYDFGGSFGGNNNEDIFYVSNMSDEEVGTLVLDHLADSTNLTGEDLEGLYGWSYTTITNLL